MDRLSFDFVVVGAGSAGCAVASRISELLPASVALIEAGPDTTHGRVSDDKGLRGLIWKYDWGFKSEPSTVFGRRIRLPRGKLVGGSSAINLGLAIRPPKEDFLKWPQNLWSWEAVLPWFRRIETDLNFENDFHGSNGPIRIAREPKERWVDIQRAFFDTCIGQGAAIIPDLNNSSSCGIGACPLNSLAGIRASIADGYLTPSRRKAVTMFPNAEVGVVITENGVAKGVMVRDHDGRSFRIDARHAVVLAAGAIGSPALLLRSGIGPADHLEDVDVRVVSDLPGVGRGIQDHPCLTVTLALKEGVGQEDDPLFQTMLLASSGVGSDPGAFDLHLLPRSSSPRTKNIPPRQLACFLFIALMSPEARGQIQLQSVAPDVPPRIDPNYLGEYADAERMLVGLEMARRIVAAPNLRRLVDFEVSPGLGLKRESSREDLGRFVGSYYHLVGGCRLGPANQTASVVDEHLRVLGVKNLYVADASVMPEIPRANTHLSAVMIGERCANFLSTASA